jgi:hypothetical protein
LSGTYLAQYEDGIYALRVQITSAKDYIFYKEDIGGELIISESLSWALENQET